MNDTPERGFGELTYWASYGLFIHHFSEVEQQLQGLLWEMSGVKKMVARAVFQDARFSNICSTINHIYTSRSQEEHPLYRRSVDQLGLINAVRNDMVHKPSAIAIVDGTVQLMVSNKVRAMPGKEKEITVTEQMLDDMTHDLHTAQIAITVVTFDSFDLPQDARELPWRDIAQRPWRYKPPPRPDAEPKSPKRRPKQKHQPAP